VKLFGFNISRKANGDTLTIDQLIERLDALARTSAGITVTPENCEQSPTVQAIVQAISGHFQALPIKVYETSRSDKGETKKELPSHPVARLLNKPNSWQTSVDYFGDAASTLVRHGRFFAVKGQGVTGPIRQLVPIDPGACMLEQDSETYDVTLRVTLAGGSNRTYESWGFHYVRLRAKDFLNGDSPVYKAREAIALEIAAQQFGSEFFGNGAMPGMVFEYMENFRGHQSPEARAEFVKSFQAAYGGNKRFRSLLLPAGIKSGEAVPVDNDKAQFLDTRKLQRNIIAGAFGVPPHLVGDLERGTFSNIEHQSQEFINKVILPYARVFEKAMERDLLTDDDRRRGVVIRFNLDAINRADFKTRQEGMKIQREMGVINANEWREREGMNPREGGDEYWDEGPSGQNMGKEGADDAPASQRSAGN
jgi:HK97 family phage portal protein